MYDSTQVTLEPCKQGIRQAFGPRQPAHPPPAIGAAGGGAPIQLGGLGANTRDNIVIDLEAEITLNGPQMNAVLDSMGRARTAVGSCVQLCEGALSAFRAEGRRMADAEDVIGSWLLQQGVARPRASA